MVKSEWTKEQNTWIENYKTGVMMPMLADWRTWKLGDSVPVATLPKDWGASVAWPAFVDEFGSNQASNTSDETFCKLKTKFLTIFRHFKADLHKKGGEHMLDLIMSGAIPLPGTNVAPMLAQQTSGDKGGVSHLFSSMLTGRQLHDIEKKEAINATVNAMRAEAGLPGNQHASLLRRELTLAWNSLAEEEQSEYSKNAEEISLNPENVYRTQKLLTTTLGGILHTLTSEGRHSAGTAAFSLFFGYRDESENIQTGTIHSSSDGSIPVWGDIGSDICASWSQFCSEYLLLPPQEELTKEEAPSKEQSAVVGSKGQHLRCIKSSSGQILFPALNLDATTPIDLRYHVEQFLLLEWQCLHKTNIPLVDIQRDPHSYLAEDTTEKFAPFLQKFTASSSIYMAAEFLQAHQFKHLFKPPPPPPPSPPPMPKTPAKKPNGRSGDVMNHAMGVDGSPSSSSEGSISPGGSTKRKPEPGLGFSVDAFDDHEEDGLFESSADDGGATNVVEVSQEVSETSIPAGNGEGHKDAEEDTERKDEPPKPKRGRPAKTKAAPKPAPKLKPARSTSKAKSTTKSTKASKKRRAGDDGEPPNAKKFKGYATLPQDAPIPVGLLDIPVDVTGGRRSRSGLTRGK